MTITISVASGYKFAAAPTATMGSKNLTVTQDGSDYVIEIGALAGNVVITASAQEIVHYSVSIPTNTVFCDSSGDAAGTPSITEGEDWTGYIRPADGYAWSVAPTSSDATVSLHSGDIYKIEATDVDANISVSGTVAQIITYNVRKHLLNMTASNSDTSVNDGSSYTTNIVKSDADYTYNADLRVIIGGVDVTSSCTIGDVTNGKSLTIPSSVIDGDIDIIASANTGKLTFEMTDSATIYINGTSYSLSAGTNVIPSGNDVFTSITKMGNTNSVNYLFCWGGNTKVTSIDFGGVPVTLNTQYFRGLTNLESISNLVASGTITIEHIFRSASSIEAFDASLCDIEVASLRYAFDSCAALTYVDLTGVRCASGGITDITNLFYSCPDSMTLRIGNLDLSGVSSSGNNKCNKVKTLICTTDTPPDAALLTYFTGLTAIYVPSNAVDTYKGTTGWSAKSSIINSINDYNPS